MSKYSVRKIYSMMMTTSRDCKSAWSRVTTLTTEMTSGSSRARLLGSSSSTSQCSLLVPSTVTLPPCFCVCCPDSMICDSVFALYQNTRYSSESSFKCYTMFYIANCHKGNRKLSLLISAQNGQCFVIKGSPTPGPSPPACTVHTKV